MVSIRLVLLTMIAHHPASQDKIRRDAESALAELEAELPPELVSTARKRGQGRALEDVMMEIIGGRITHSPASNVG